MDQARFGEEHAMHGIVKNGEDGGRRKRRRRKGKGGIEFEGVKGLVSSLAMVEIEGNVKGKEVVLE